MKRKLQQWNLALTALGAMLGTFIEMTIIYLTTGKFDLSLLLGALTAATIVIIINTVKVPIKKGNLPETDERLRENMRNNPPILIPHFIAGLFLALTILTF